MKLFNVRFSGYFGKILIDELPSKSIISNITDQFRAEAINYSDFNRIGKYKGYKTHLIVEANYYKNKRG